MLPGKKDAQAGALDALMSSGSEETPTGKQPADAAAPKEDPSALLESIRADVEKLSALLSTMG